LQSLAALLFLLRVFFWLFFLAPSSDLLAFARASERPMAMACLRLFTVPPCHLALFNVRVFSLCIAHSTSSSRSWNTSVPFFLLYPSQHWFAFMRDQKIVHIIVCSSSTLRILRSSRAWWIVVAEIAMSCGMIDRDALRSILLDHVDKVRAFRILRRRIFLSDCRD